MLKGLLWLDENPLLSTSTLSKLPVIKAMTSKGHSTYAPRSKFQTVEYSGEEIANAFAFDRFLQHDSDLDLDLEAEFTDEKLYKLRVPYKYSRAPIYLTMRMFVRNDVGNQAMLWLYRVAMEKLKYHQGLLIPQKWVRLDDRAVAFYQPVGRSLHQYLLDDGLDPAEDPIPKI